MNNNQANFTQNQNMDENPWNPVKISNLREHYCDSIQALAADLSHNRELDTSAGGKEYSETISIEGQTDKVTFRISVNTKNHFILDASFHATENTANACPTEMALLESLARTIKSKTVQEMNDHAVLTMEFDLRDPSKERPVSGIVIPQTAEPAFFLPLSISRGLFSQYSKANDYLVQYNAFETPVAKEWVSLDNESKEKAIRDSFQAFEKENNLPAESFHLSRMEGLDKVIIVINGEFHADDKAKMAMDVEDFLQKQVNSKLVVYMEELKDLSPIRRL